MTSAVTGGEAGGGGGVGRGAGVGGGGGGGGPPTWMREPCSSALQAEQCRTGRNGPPQAACVSSMAGTSGAQNQRSPQSSMTMTCGKNARPLSVSGYSSRPDPALTATVSSTPIWQTVRSRSETMVGGAPIMVSMSVNRRAPRNAAARADADHRLPISSMVWGPGPGPLVPGSAPEDRRRVVACGTDRAKPPLGPNSPVTSWIPAGSPQPRQCIAGENSAPQSRWYIPGSGSMCSVTQTASHDQMVSSTLHRSRPQSVSTYSKRRGACEYWDMVNTPASVRRRSRAGSTELAMPSPSRKSLYRRTPDMMASRMMDRFHSSPISPRAMALEFSVGPGSAAAVSSAVMAHHPVSVGPGAHQPLMDSPGAQQLCVPLAIRSGSWAR